MNERDIDLSLRDKSGLSPFATALIYKNNKAAETILQRYPSAVEQVGEDSRLRIQLETA